MILVNNKFICIYNVSKSWFWNHFPMKKLKQTYFSVTLIWNNRQKQLLFKEKVCLCSIHNSMSTHKKILYHLHIFLFHILCSCSLKKFLQWDRDKNKCFRNEKFWHGSSILLAAAVTNTYICMYYVKEGIVLGLEERHFLQ